MHLCTYASMYLCINTSMHECWAYQSIHLSCIHVWWLFNRIRGLVTHLKMWYYFLDGLHIASMGFPFASEFRKERLWARRESLCRLCKARMSFIPPTSFHQKNVITNFKLQIYHLWWELNLPYEKCGEIWRGIGAWSCHDCRFLASAEFNVVHI